MNYTDFYKFAKGKTGYIYVARKGSSMVFIIDDKSYLLSTTMDNGTVLNPVPDYWCHSIDFAGGFTDYFTFGMIPGPDAAMPYPARPIRPISDMQRAKLSKLQEV